jgi:uncharacterized protein
MMEVTFYPHSCATVESVQTLTAWLLFAGDFVYKIRKPVHFSFIDARTPARRYRLCRDELVLNQRLAPEVYLNVAGLAAQSEGYSLVQNTAVSTPDVREFAVVMHRLPSERMLSRMAATQKVSLADIEQLAARLVAFHSDCSIAKSKTWGSAPALSRLVAETVAEADALVADTIMRNRLGATARYLRGYVITHQRLLDDRARRGRVRDGHGDLRADSACLMPENCVIIGRIGYSERLRYCDVASDLASVMLDLEAAGYNDLSGSLAHAYVAASQDVQLADLIPFYKCYHALRRGTIEMLTSLQTEMPRERRMLARNYASDWVQMAERFARDAAAL